MMNQTQCAGAWPRLHRMTWLGALVLVLVAVPWARAEVPGAPTLRVGWAQADITPDRPVVITGQFAARVSEGVRDPITATALALESVAEGAGAQAVLVSCDLIGISEALRERVREQVHAALPELAPQAVVLNATHTHAAPELRTEPELAEGLGIDVPAAWSRWGIALDAMSPREYEDFAAARIAGAVIEAWQARQPGGMSYGLGHAVVGHNRLVSYMDGRTQMYGSTNRPDFSHMEEIGRASCRERVYPRV